MMREDEGARAEIRHAFISLQPTQGQAVAMLISVLQYLVATGAALNVMMTYIQVGQRSILSWGCTTTFTPVLWTSMAAVVHVVAAISYIITRQASRERRVEKAVHPSSGRRQPRLYRRITKQLCDVFRLLGHSIKSETTFRAKKRSALPHDPKAAAGGIPRSAILLNIAAGCFGFVHVVSGTIAFSSLQFVSVWDVMNSILWRYMLSTAVCRLILVLELEGMKGSMTGTGTGTGTGRDGSS
jgi:hypothetical protein